MKSTKDAPRSRIAPIVECIPPARQETARHYGAHPYFTRRPANVVRAYVERFTVRGDTVLDPYGGTGVTAIEAMLLGRRAIQNDVNPFANFITAAIADTSLRSTTQLKEEFERLEKRCRSRIQEIQGASASHLERVLKTVHLPDDLALPSTSDVLHYHELFTPRQLAGLALLKDGIDQVKNPGVRIALLLAWSATLAKLNKTFLSAKGRRASRGGSSIFSIYRYKVAKNVVELPIWDTFRGRVENVIEAKDEVLRHLEHAERTIGEIDSARELRIMALDAVDLPSALGADSVDYIFTDPPYGGHIAYLDLSTLWNHWLGFEVSDRARESEAIVGGERHHTEEHYKDKLGKSVRACLELLRPDRWFSIVFQHWDTSYFSTILESAESGGAELRAAVSQEPEVIWSMHKKKNAETVLSGELILTFYKGLRGPRPRRRSKCEPSTFEGILDRILPEFARSGGPIRGERLFNRIIVEAWNRGCLDAIHVSPEAFNDCLRKRGWTYQPQQHLWVSGTGPKQQLEMFEPSRV